MTATERRPAAQVQRPRASVHQLPHRALLGHDANPGTVDRARRPCDKLRYGEHRGRALYPYPFLPFPVHLLRLQHARNAQPWPGDALRGRAARGIRHLPGAPGQQMRCASAKFTSVAGRRPFFVPPELDALVAGILSRATVCPDASLSLEVDPRTTTRDQLEVCSGTGSTALASASRISTRACRTSSIASQSEDQVREVTETARELGFKSVNFDLIYGLPLQTLDEHQRDDGRGCPAKDRTASPSMPMHMCRGSSPASAASPRQTCRKATPSARSTSWGARGSRPRATRKSAWTTSALPTDDLLLAAQERSPAPKLHGLHACVHASAHRSWRLLHR